MSRLIDEYTKNKSPEDKKEVERRVREMAGTMSELSALMLVLEEMRQEKANGGIMRLGFQDGTDLVDFYTGGKYNADTANEKLSDLASQAKFNIQKGLDDVTGIGRIETDFPGSFSAASGVPSDFRHQAAANLLAETLGKGAYTDPILGPISYASGAIGSAGLGFGKEVMDLAKGLMDPNLTKKEAFSEFLKDNLSNIKGAFKLPGTTTEQLYDELMGDYQMENPFGILRSNRAMMIQEAQQRAIDAMLKNRRDENKKIKTTKPGTSGGFIPTKKTKKTTPVTGTTKPGTGGGGGGFTPTTTAQNVARTTSRVEDGRVKAYGLAKGGLAAMLGE